MDMRSVGSIGQNYVKPAAPQAAKKQEQAQEPRDQVSIGGKVGGFAKKAVKVVAGVATGAVVGTAKAVTDGLGGSAEAALDAVGMGEIRADDGLLKKVAQGIVVSAPVFGATVALVTGAGPVGAMIAGMMLPGSLVGAGVGIKGFINGASSGLDFALQVGQKADEKVASKMGKIAGKVAKFATSVALGAVMIPVAGLMSSVHEGIGFAERAIGVNKDPKNAGQAVDSLVKEGVVLYGGITGAMGASGLIGTGVGVGSSAGAIATGVAGFNEAIDGFAGGAKQGYDMAGNFIDKITQ